MIMSHMSSQPSMDSANLRRLLFDASRSLPDAQAYFEGRLDDAELLKLLIEIASADSTDTARLQACYYIAQFPVTLLRNYEDVLLRLQAEQWESLADHAIVALAKLHSKKSLALLIEKRLAPKLPWESEILRRHLGDILDE
jgi:hypothetical protein